MMGSEWAMVMMVIMIDCRWVAVAKLNFSEYVYWCCDLMSLWRVVNVIYFRKGVLISVWWRGVQCKIKIHKFHTLNLKRARKRWNMGKWTACIMTECRRRYHTIHGTDCTCWRYRNYHNHNIHYYNWHTHTHHHIIIIIINVRNILPQWKTDVLHLFWIGGSTTDFSLPMNKSPRLWYEQKYYNKRYIDN